MSAEELAVWVAASCERHGVPFKITDRIVLSKVVTLLGGPTVGPRSDGGALARRRPTSEPPHDIDPIGV